MVLLNRIYTRSGDRGQTRLATGEKVSKADPRVAALGEVDELNAHLGQARLAVSEDLDEMLGRIQNELFDLGADLATPEGTRARVSRRVGAEALRITAGQVERLEKEIDALNAGLEPLTSFILPAGGTASVALHLARTVCRRAERAVVAFAQGGEGRGEGATHAEALRYLNRLSDVLFVAARVTAAEEGGDVLWAPGATR
ncbi:MAG: cob(I)yrinic acid a,c-diamide adenosyltransferase [Caulobacteraceae bacterium]